MAGSVELAQSTGSKAYFGPAPHLRFLESSRPGATDEQLHETARHAPEGLTPEDQYRYVERRLPPKESHLLARVMSDIQRKFEEEGPFDCMLGHSEGASIAATFLVHGTAGSAPGKGGIVPPKCAVFMNGAVPHTADGKGWLLADECGVLIRIPTCHVVAYNDAMVDQAVALYHLCDEEVAVMVDHGRGHAIPRDARSCRLMVRAIRDMMERTGRLADGDDQCSGESG